MAHKDWCGKDCGKCATSCTLDEAMPCGPNCENVNEDGAIQYEKCLQEKCDIVAYWVPCGGKLKDIEVDCEGNCDEAETCEALALAKTLEEKFGLIGDVVNA